jgi:peroxiredoxin
MLGRVLQAGAKIPDVRVWMAPQEPVSLRELAEEKPLLLLFYLFDWSST